VPKAVHADTTSASRASRRCATVPAGQATNTPLSKGSACTAPFDAPCRLVALDQRFRKGFQPGAGGLAGMRASVLNDGRAGSGKAA
jgi:hypothetical protein